MFLPALSKAFETLFCFPKPVVAAINGHAIAGGCVLACAADYRIMAQQTGRIGVPELLVGIPFPTVAVEIMRCVTAPEHFQTLLYGGVTLAPEDAAQRGLVDAIAEPGNLLDLAVAKVESLAALPAAAFELTKRQIHEPQMRRVREDGPRFDAIVRELWASPSGSPQSAGMSTGPSSDRRNSSTAGERKERERAQRRQKIRGFVAHADQRTVAQTKSNSLWVLSQFCVFRVFALKFGLRLEP